MTIIAALLLLVGCSPSDALEAVPHTAVRLDDVFWAPRLETNRAVSIPHAFRQCEQTGRLANFVQAAAVLSGERAAGTFASRFGFDDSDVFKVIEGASYALQTHPDPALDAYLDSVIALIAAAQEDDGYLYTMRTMRAPNSWAPERWVNARTKGSHELYNVGHLYEAAVAHHAATGKRTLLDVALANADLLVATFGPDRMRTAPGHQETEIGLVRLYRLTGRRQYLELAEFFLQERGRGPQSGDTYNQDHRPVTEQTEAVGHAVRACYQYAAMADVAAETGHGAYLEALEQVWDDIVRAKIYVTGGIGAAGRIEGFASPYDLPNYSAYCETCAAIAMVFWNHRMFLQTGDGRYMDVLERVLYNAVLSGIGRGGDRFFYVNPLESQVGAERAAWFACACCPSNVVRFLPRVPGYAYAHRRGSLYVNLFMAGNATVSVDGSPVMITQDHRYPWDGQILLRVDPREPREFSLHLRIPGWTRDAPIPGGLYRTLGHADDGTSLVLNDRPIHASLEDGYAVVTRRWMPGDRVRIELPMPVRRVVADEALTYDRGRVVLERGPVVYCLEAADTGSVWDLVIPDTALLRTETGEFPAGVPVIHGTGLRVSRSEGGSASLGPPQAFRAIPYAHWAHRGPRQMAVWIARTPLHARPRPAPSIASTSTITSSGGKRPEALADQLLPDRADDPATPFFHWFPKRGTTEWVEYAFERLMEVSRTRIVWVEDGTRGGCSLPRAWRLLARVEGVWREVDRSDDGATASTVRDLGNLQTDGLRLELELREGHSAGIFEWQVD